MTGSERPHVLFVVMDAARRDAFGTYAASPDGGTSAPSAALTGVATPMVDALARRGVAVTRARATASWTLPSHVAMFSGALASRFGLDQAPGGDPRSVGEVLAPHADGLLASVLSAAGYATHGYSANLWVSPHSGLDAGFGDFHYAPSARLDRAAALAASSRTAQLAPWVLEGLRARQDSGAAEIGRRLRGAIADAPAAAPQFWFVNLVDAHSPYLPPRPFNDLGVADRVGAALDCARYLNFEAICVAAAGGLAPPRASLERLAYLHRRAVAYLDTWLAGILTALARRAMLENTLVIIASDHGECFGEEGLMAHGFNVLDALIDVPLVVAGPGADGFVRGAGALSLRELPGLIAGAVGLDDAGFGPHGDGIAVSRTSAICPPDDPRMLAFAERWSLSDAQVRRLTADRWIASDGVSSLTVTDGVSVGATDPDNAALAAALAQAQHAAVASTPAPSAELPDGAGDPAVAELERQMKLLGYM